MHICPAILESEDTGSPRNLFDYRRTEAMRELLHWIQENQEPIKNGAAGIAAALLTILFFSHAGAALGIAAVCMILITVFHGWEI